MTENDRRLANAALKSGNRKEARRILRPLVHQAPDDWTLWWQLALATDEVEQKITCLKQVVRLNPRHSDAAKLLRQIERMIARPTPLNGIRRPVHNTDQVEDVRSAAPVVREDDRSLARKPAKASVIPTAVVAVAVGILAVIIGGAYIAYGGFNKSLRATDVPSRALSIQVDGCIVDGSDAAIITFKNLTGEEITLTKGKPEAEEELFKLAAESESSIDVDPDEPIRYAASVNEGVTDGGGAIITVPAGSSCVVVIR